MINRIFNSLVLLTITILSACQTGAEKQQQNELSANDNNQVIVYNYDNKKAFEAFKQQNLDATHANLLNPQIAKDDMKQIVASWTELHQEVMTVMKEHQFDWGVEDSTVGVLDRIYFDKKGQITAYFFRVLNEHVDQNKTEEFAAILQDFSKNHSISIKRDSAFAQCGKVSYVNY